MIDYNIELAKRDEALVDAESSLLSLFHELEGMKHEAEELKIKLRKEAILRDRAEKELVRKDNEVKALMGKLAEERKKSKIVEIENTDYGQNQNDDVSANDINEQTYFNIEDNIGDSKENESQSLNQNGPVQGKINMQPKPVVSCTKKSKQGDETPEQEVKEQCRCFERNISTAINHDNYLLDSLQKNNIENVTKEERFIWENEVQNLKQKCRNLEGDLLEVQISSQLLREVRQRKETLAKELSQTKKELIIRNYDVQDLEKKCSQLEEKLREKELDSSLKVENDIRSALFTELQIKNKVLTDEITHMKDESRTLQDQAVTLIRASMRSEIGNMETNSKKEKNMKTKYVSLEEYKVLERQAVDLEKTLNALKESTRSNLRKLAINNKQLQQDLHTVTNKVTTLQTEFDEKKVDYEEVLATLVERTKSLQELASRNKHLENDFEDARNCAMALQGNLAQTEFEHEETKANLSDSTKALQKLLNKYKLLERAFNKLQDEENSYAVSPTSSHKKTQLKPTKIKAAEKGKKLKLKTLRKSK